jgi:hypothetical protein
VIWLLSAAWAITAYEYLGDTLLFFHTELERESVRTGNTPKVKMSVSSAEVFVAS